MIDAFSSREPVSTSLENALFGLAAAIIGLAEAGGLRVVLRTEPALRIVQAGIGAASLQMIDADIAGEAGAGSELALDRASGRLRDIFGKQRGADFLVAVGAAGASSFNKNCGSVARKFSNACKFEVLRKRLCSTSFLMFAINSTNMS